MTKSKITKLFDGVAAAESTTSAEIYPQRLLDETGAIQIFVDGDPGTSTGQVSVQGRLDALASWVDVATLTFAEVGGANPRSKIEADVDILPQMRAKMTATSGTFTATGFNVDFWIME